MISINATLVLQVVHLLILVFILNRLMFRPILKLINERTEYIKKTKDQIEEIERETDRLKNEYLSRGKEARKVAVRERLELKSMGLAQVEELIEDSLRKVDSIREEGEKKAEKEVVTTRPLLEAEAKILAEEIIERVIGRRIAG
ncbi:MAG: hypothetical protein PVG99_00790 [Desulfobacteraceae bacterium]|jgi:F-type H+-transporting ATPase subunit b